MIQQQRRIPESVRRAWVRVALAAACCGLGGCCSAPEASRYFDRLTPFNTVNAFVYAVEAGQWDFVYDCLSSADRRHEITPLKIRIGINFFKDPRTGIPIKDIVLRAERHRADCFVQPGPSGRGEGRVATMDIFYEGETSDGIPVEMLLTLYLVKESIDGSHPLWRLSFERTLRDVAGGGVAARAPISAKVVSNVSR